MRLGSNLIIYTAPLITGAQLKKNHYPFYCYKMLKSWGQSCSFKI